MRKDSHGPEAFERYYEELFADRWTSLRSALLSEHRYATIDDCLTQPYYLDAASLAVARALAVSPGQAVLDLCAAPGGKTLVLACALGGDGKLVANERSATRRGRLRRVLEDHLPPELRGVLTVTSHDAARWGIYEPNAYDRVLADVPCSSERHVMQSAGDLARWSASRPRRLAQAAYAIGCAAVDSVRTGGMVAYSTCALSPLENDGVVGRLIKRGSGVLSIARDAPSTDSSPLVWEPTEFGAVILPDRNNGAGPMYFALLQK